MPPRVKLQKATKVTKTPIAQARQWIRTGPLRYPKFPCNKCGGTAFTTKNDKATVVVFDCNDCTNTKIIIQEKKLDGRPNYNTIPVQPEAAS